MSAFMKKQFKNGAVIFQEGDEGKYLCEILRGSVCICKNHGEPGEKQLTVLEVGAYFGEMGLIDALPRSATAVAEGNCELLMVAEEDFSEYLKMNPDIALKIMRTLSARLRELTGDFMEACGTISEALKMEEHKKSKSLMGRLKKFADIYQESCDALYQVEKMNFGPGGNTAFYNGFHNWY